MLCSWIKESFMHEFSSTEEVVTFRFTNFSIRSNAKGLIFEKNDSFEAILQVQVLLLSSSHFKFTARHESKWFLVDWEMSTTPGQGHWPPGNHMLLCSQPQKFYYITVTDVWLYITVLLSLHFALQTFPQDQMPRVCSLKRMIVLKSVFSASFCCPAISTVYY